MKGLINFKSINNKCFFWCHIRHLKLLKIHRESVTKADKTMVNDVDYEDIQFPVSKKDFNKTEKKNNICFNVCCYENNLVYPVYVSAQNFEECMDLLMMKISHIMSVLKILTYLCVIREKVKIKNTVTSIAYNVLVVKEFW